MTADDLAEWPATSDTRKVLAWVERHRNLSVDFPPHEGSDPFFNINTPEDLVQAERMLADTSDEPGPSPDENEKTKANA
ncbi:hypothetical protein [Breoghania sp.]|uniref:hypothetical protein n=1 Tax=Breoghania sp. TaxID=2065378 RepID=UPI002633B379|nr:hypothetical protein [Breoghania sp.]MDJ0931361.1 hypothetical protein [Breoghania sp.]